MITSCSLESECDVAEGIVIENLWNESLPGQVAFLIPRLTDETVMRS